MRWFNWPHACASSQQTLSRRAQCTDLITAGALHSKRRSPSDRCFRCNSAPAGQCSRRSASAAFLRRHCQRHLPRNQQPRSPQRSGTSGTRSPARHSGRIQATSRTKRKALSGTHSASPFSGSASYITPRAPDLARSSQTRGHNLLEHVCATTTTASSSLVIRAASSPSCCVGCDGFGNTLRHSFTGCCTLCNAELDVTAGSRELAGLVAAVWGHHKRLHAIQVKSRLD